MSQKYKDKVLQGCGVSNKKFESEYAMKLMQKMGWSNGQGLGKNKDGQTECIQIERRPDFQALGNKQISLGQSWKDLWWEQSYSQSLKNLKPISSINLQEQVVSEDEEEKFSDYEKQKRSYNNKHAKTCRVLPEVDDSDEDVFIQIRKKIVKKSRKD